MTESGASSAPSTPISMLPLNNPFYESNLQVTNQDDQSTIWDVGVQGSPGSKRCPTFKDYAEKIKHLQQENFQLRVRIFMSEQKTGVKTSSSDFAVLFQQNMQHLQNAFNAHNNTSSVTHSMTAASSSSSSNDVLPMQISALKSQNEHVNMKLAEMEYKIHNYETALKEKQTENEKLIEKNDNLLGQLQDLETEVMLNKMQHQSIQAQSRNIDDEVERGARIAFSQFDEDVGDSRKHESDVKLMEYKDKIHQLEKKLAKYLRELEKSSKNVAQLEKDKKETDQKILECSKALMEFGRQNITLKNDLESLQAAHHRSINESRVGADSAIMERYGSIRKLVALLQSRLLEIVKFIEVLFTLESKKVFTLTGLKDRDRDSLKVSVDQCKLHSQSLDQLFEMGDDSEISRRINLTGSLLNQDATYNSHQYSMGHSNTSITTPRRRSGKDMGVQCKLLMESPISPDKSKWNRLKKEFEMAEEERKKLISEQSQYCAHIAMLESKLRFANDQITKLEKATRIISSQPHEALQEENRTLGKRLELSDSTLNKLHQEHAKLVGELKRMKSMECFQAKEIQRPTDSTSPDLGIDSGHDGAVNSDDSNSNINFKAENRILRSANKDLAHKLRTTRESLNLTVEKLHSTTKQKEQVEKAICRQLHKTHTILRQAKKSVEKYTTNQCQENMMPSMDAYNVNHDEN